MVIKQHSLIPYQIFSSDDLFTPDEIAELRRYVSTTLLKVGNITNHGLACFLYRRMIWGATAILPVNYVDDTDRLWYFIPNDSGIIHTLTYVKLTDNETFSSAAISRFKAIIFLNDPHLDYIGGTIKFESANANISMPPAGTVLVYDTDLYPEVEADIAGSQNLIILDIKCSTRP